MKFSFILNLIILATSILVLSSCKKYEEEKFDFSSSSPAYLELKNKTAKTLTEGTSFSFTVQVRTAITEDVVVKYEITGGFSQSGEMKLPANSVEATAEVLVPTGTVKSPAIIANGVFSIKSATKKSGGQLTVGKLTSSTEKFNLQVKALTASLNVVHVSPDAPAVDLLIDSVKVNASALSFLDSSGYIKVVAGTRNIKVNASGSTTSVIDKDITFIKDKNYSLFAINVLSSISAILVVDSLAAPQAGKANIRFFHLSPDAPPVTVGVIIDGLFTPIFSDRSFEDQSSATLHQTFISVDAGVYEVEVRDANTGVTVLNIPDFTLTDGKIYTIYAKGLVAGSGEQALGAAVIRNN